MDHALHPMQAVTLPPSAMPSGMNFVPLHARIMVISRNETQPVVGGHERGAIEVEKSRMPAAHSRIRSGRMGFRHQTDYGQFQPVGPGRGVGCMIGDDERGSRTRVPRSCRRD